MTDSRICTATGALFDALDPDVELIRIEDIAQSLARQCRFLGHTRVPYTVAEHSVRVSWLLEAQGCSRETILWGLLHDASEAYLGDLPAPIKHTTAFEAYRVVERAVQAAICTRFGLPIDEPAEVRAADERLLATEVRDLMPAIEWPRPLPEPLLSRIEPWSEQYAKGSFLRTFQHLTGEHT